MKTGMAWMFLLAAVLAGCSTAAVFKLPPGTDILIKGERAVKTEESEGLPSLRTRPFFWSSMGGIQYSLIQGDKVVKEGRLPSRFRIASIFWPPYALIYWPVGFRFHCYDLTKNFVEKCAAVPDSAAAGKPQEKGPDK